MMDEIWVSLGEVGKPWVLESFAGRCESRPLRVKGRAGKKKWTKQGTLLVHVHRLDSGIKPRPGLGRINPQNKSRIPKKGQKKGV